MACDALHEMEVFSEKPEPRSGHRACSTSNHMIVYGGYDRCASDKIYTEIICFNTISRKWAELPHSRGVRFESASSSMALFHNNLMIFGGSGYPFGHTNSNDLSVYSLKAKTWSRLGSKPPLARYGQSMVLTAVENCPRLYIFSGTVGREFLDDMHYFDLIENNWHSIQTDVVPAGRYRHETVVFEGDFYLFGGSVQLQSFGFHHLWQFSFSKHRWTKIECKPTPDGQFPSPRKAHSCIIWHGVVYMAGGCNENTTLKYNDIWSICLKDFTWKKLNIVLPVPLYFHSASVTPDGCMNIFGGVDDTGKRSSSTYEIWLDVSSLLKITFRFILDRLGHNHDHYLTLKNLGVPTLLLDDVFKEFPAG
eukprot:gene10924-19758_t